jgi:hypothetical protein
MNGQCYTRSLDAVRKEELAYIAQRRRKDASKPPASATETESSLVGLALSGGGIRSATTNLGVLQALSRMNLLPEVDYLCTVSGGGYIGACLTALLSIADKPPAANGSSPCPAAPSDAPPDYDYQDRARLRFGTSWQQFPFNADVASSPAGSSPRSPEDSPGRKIVAHLRTHGTFLIARRGLFERDALRAVGHLVAGTVYHLVTTLLVLFVVTLILMGVAHWIEPDLDHRLRVPVHRTVREVASVRPADGSANYTVTQADQITLLDHLSDRFGLTWTDLTADSSARPLIGAALWGLFASVVVFVTFGGFVHLNKEWPTTWSPGESREERFDRVLLRVAAGVVALFLVIACWPLPGMKTNARVGCIAGPAIVLAGACITNFVLYTLMARLDASRTGALDLWSRKFRSLWGSFTAFAVYGLGAALLFACLPIVAYAVEAAMDTEASLWALIAPVVSLVAGRVLVGGEAAGVRRLRPRLPTSVTHFLLGVIVCVFVGFALIAFGAIGVHYEFMKPAWLPRGYWIGLTVASGFLVLLSLFGNINRISPHYFYRDRLLETYLRTEARGHENRMETFADMMEMPLVSLQGDDPPTKEALANTAPYLLISAAINLSGSRDLTRKDRKSAHFLFSKYYCGSRQTGYRRTDCYRGGQTRLGGAITISGAAASSAVGYHTFFAQSFLTSILNLRLGVWLVNPRTGGQGERVFWPRYMLSEVFGGANECRPLINLSDGGHTGDNIGIYPLFERRCQVIIASDAEADATLSFGSFTEALRQAYVDLGVDVDIDLSMIRPDPKTGLSRSHCAVGRIRYPDRPNQPGWLIYLKSSLTGDEPAPVLNYRSTSPAFPHETTADQFFDDAQFESIARRARRGGSLRRLDERDEDREEVAPGLDGAAAPLRQTS